MRNVSKKTGHRISTLTAVLICTAALFAFTGCEDSRGNVPRVVYGDSQEADPRANMSAEERMQEKKVWFEEMRQGNRKFLAEAAKNKPEELGMALLSLTDYHPITRMEEFVTKYSNLKVKEFQFSVLGAVHLFKVDMNLPLHDEVERSIKEDRARLEGNIREYGELKNPQSRNEAIAFEQKYLDAVNTGNVRTCGFAIIGKLKDIETMAQAEFGGKFVRVIQLAAGVDDSVPTNYFDPVDAQGIPAEEAFK